MDWFGRNASDLVLVSCCPRAVLCSPSEVEVAAGSDLADLFIVGADFYSGSTGKAIRNGWCDFEALGQAQAQKRFGNDWKLGRIWYVAERVPPNALKGFEEHERQNTWLKAQGPKVVRVVIDSKQVRKNSPPLGAGEFSFRTEADAITAIRGGVLARAAMVISASNETSLLTFLDEAYRRQQEILLPPESAVAHIGRRHRLEYADLEAAPLNGTQNNVLWQAYRRSRNDRSVVARWLDEIRDSEESGWLHQFLQGRLPPSPKNFLAGAHAEQAIIDKVSKRIARYLEAHGGVNQKLARREDCINFIARSLIKVVADELFEERFGPEPEQQPSIRRGLDLIDQAARLYPKIEICEEAEKQIREMKGTEKYFEWVLDAFYEANRVMIGWNGGELPHRLLPGKATPESEQTMNKYGTKRFFRTRSGQKLLFEWHMKHHAENQRIHYRVDAERRLLMIGYVGEHLPTARYPT